MRLLLRMARLRAHDADVFDDDAALRHFHVAAGEIRISRAMRACLPIRFDSLRLRSAIRLRVTPRRLRCHYCQIRVIVLAPLMLRAHFTRLRRLRGAMLP